jgi:hypothetical protein
MPFAVAIPMIAALFILGTIGGAASSGPDAAGSVVMTRQGLLSGIAPSEGQVPTDTTITLPDFVPSSFYGDTSVNGVTNSNSNNQVVSAIDTLRPQDVTINSATMRGTLSGANGSTVFFIQSASAPALTRAAAAASYDSLVSNRPSQVSIQYATTYGADTTIRQSLYGLKGDTTYYYQLCVDDVRNGIICGDVVKFRTTTPSSRNTYFSVPTAQLNTATGIGAESATIAGTYQANDGEAMTVFLVYSENSEQVQSVSQVFTDYQAVRASALETVRIKANTSSDGDFSYTVDELENDTTYYYGLCIEYSGTEEGLVCISGYSFTTKDRDRDIPQLSLQVTPASRAATFVSKVAMNDYFDGQAFLVYGTSQSQISAVADSYSYDYIYQRGDELQVISLDADMDGTDTFSTTIRDITGGMNYFASTCVEYEATDEYGYDRTEITCSRLVPFYLP